MILNVVTPHGAKFLDLEVKSVTLPGILGEMEILPGHEAFMSALDIGILKVVTADGREIIATVGSGYVEVLGDQCKCLVEFCETPDEIDLQRAENKLKESEEAIKDLDPLSKEYQAKLKSIKKARVRIQVAQKNS